MAELDGHRVVAKGAQQPFQVLARRRRILEARGKLREHGAELAARGQRIDPAAELVEIRGVGKRERAHRVSIGAGVVGQRVDDPFLEHARVGELLIQLHRELEAVRRPIRPRARHLRARLTVEGRIHLDGVEVLRVERELVEALRPLPRRRVEHTVPRPAARRVIPSRRADAQVRAWRIDPCRSRTSRATP